METKAAVHALASLAQETRLELFRLLVQVGPQGLPAGEIAEALGVPNNTLSFHLSHLTQGGLLVSRRDGRSVIYAINVQGIQELFAFLMEDCCQGRKELYGKGRANTNCCAAPEVASAGRRGKSR